MSINSNYFWGDKVEVEIDSDKLLNGHNLIYAVFGDENFLNYSVHQVAEIYGIADCNINIFNQLNASRQALLEWDKKCKSSKSSHRLMVVLQNSELINPQKLYELSYLDFLYRTTDKSTYCSNLISLITLKLNAFQDIIEDDGENYTWKDVLQKSWKSDFVQFNADALIGRISRRIIQQDDFSSICNDSTHSPCHLISSSSEKCKPLSHQFLHSFQDYYPTYFTFIRTECIIGSIIFSIIMILVIGRDIWSYFKTIKLKHVHFEEKNIPPKPFQNEVKLSNSIDCSQQENKNFDNRIIQNKSPLSPKKATSFKSLKKINPEKAPVTGNQTNLGLNSRGSTPVKSTNSYKNNKKSESTDSRISPSSKKIKNEKAIEVQTVEKDKSYNLRSRSKPNFT